MTLEETLAYLQSIEKVIAELIIDRQIFLDFDAALLEQKAKNNLFISWCLRNYHKATILNLCKILEPRKNDSKKRTLQYFINWWKKPENHQKLEQYLETQFIIATDIDTGEKHQISISENMLEDLKHVNFDEDLAKIQLIHEKLKTYRDTKLCHNDCRELSISLPQITEINDFITDLEIMINKYFHIFCRQAYSYEALKTPQFYHDFNLHLN